MNQLISFLGIFVFIGLAFLFSNAKKNINWTFVFKALCLQGILAILVLGIPALNIPGPFAFVFEYANHMILRVLQFSEEGSRFLLDRKSVV
mgnify:CR=1 FL=1